MKKPIVDKQFFYKMMGEEILRRRLEMEISQRDMACLINKSLSSYRHYEKGTQAIAMSMWRWLSW